MSDVAQSGPAPQPVAVELTHTDTRCSLPGGSACPPALEADSDPCDLPSTAAPCSLARRRRRRRSNTKAAAAADTASTPATATITHTQGAAAPPLLLSCCAPSLLSHSL